MTTAPLRVLGLDPGLNHTGWGIIEPQGTRILLISSGVINPPSQAPLAERLGVIARHIQELIATHHPTLCAIERVFVNVNPQSTLRLGFARGAAMTAAALSGLTVDEYTPGEIKQAVAGFGAADKQMIQTIVMRLLNLATLPRTDEADAIACAICALNSHKLQNLQRQGIERAYGLSRQTGASQSARKAWTQLIGKQVK